MIVSIIVSESPCGNVGRDKNKNEKRSINNDYFNNT
jgi:hypothetical protein